MKKELLQEVVVFAPAFVAPVLFLSGLGAGMAVLLILVRVACWMTGTPWL